MFIAIAMFIDNKSLLTITNIKGIKVYYITSCVRSDVTITFKRAISQQNIWQIAIIWGTEFKIQYSKVQTGVNRNF